MLSLSLLHGLINTSTVMPLEQWSEAAVAVTQWKPRKAPTCPYRSCPFSPFLHLCDPLPAIYPSWKLAFPLVYEGGTLPYRELLASQRLYQRLRMALWGQRLSHFLSYAMPMTVMQFLNIGLKLGTVNIAWKILGGQHSQLDQHSASPGWTENFELKPDHWIA